MATFTVGSTTITFAMLLDGAELGRTAAVSVRHIPGGNVTYTDTAGLEAPSLRCRAKLATFADLISLQTILGASGTLTYTEATFTAILRSAVRNKITGRASEQSIASLDFVLVL